MEQKQRLMDGYVTLKHNVDPDGDYLIKGAW